MESEATHYGDFGPTDCDLVSILNAGKDEELFSLLKSSSVELHVKLTIVKELFGPRPLRVLLFVLSIQLCCCVDLEVNTWT